MLKNLRMRVLSLTSVLTVSMAVAYAQPAKESELFQLLKEKDNQMFNVGFNHCNIEQLEELTYEDFEFYHDKDGITSSKKAFLKVVKEDLCGSGKNVISRVLNENSLEVFPMYKGDKLYAAMQTGVHSFGNSTAKFMHLWLLDNEEWKLSRVMSYDHQNENVTIDEVSSFLTLSNKVLMLYVGNYQFSPDFILSIVNEGDKLYGDSQGEKVEIKPYDEHKFVAIDNSAKIHFNLDVKGGGSGLNNGHTRRWYDRKKS